MISTVQSLIARLRKSKETHQGENRFKQQEELERYAVFDRDACYVGIHNSLKAAKKQWKDQTERQGSILDIDTRRDVTPLPKWWEDFLRWFFRMPGFGHCGFPACPTESEHTVTPPMSQAVLDWLRKKGGRGWDLSRHSSNRPDVDDLDLLYKLVERLNQMDLPVYNIAKKRREKTKKLVPIKKRRQRVRKIEVTVPEEKERVLTHVRKTPSVFPENDMDIRPIRSVTEIRRLAHKTDLGLPRAMLNRKLVQHQLAVTEYQAEETYEEIITESSTKTVVVDEPYVEEYVDYIEVAQEPHGQLLYILRDGSGSMSGFKTHLAAALAIAVIGRNLKNSSKYLYRIFGYDPEKQFTGSTKEEKEELVQSIIADHCESGGGTRIAAALRAAATEIRRIAKPDDQPEILLITDGLDSLSAEDVYGLIGEDIVLHTVVVDEHNSSLRQHSSTYVQLLEESFEKEVTDDDSGN